MSKKTTLIITPGDPDGIGPEVVWKALQKRSNLTRWKNFSLLCVGARRPFEKLGAKIIDAAAGPGGLIELAPPRSSQPHIWLLPAPSKAPSRRFLPGFQCGWSIETATRLIQAGAADALVTGPISKERLQKGGYPFVGHTDFLADLSNVEDDFTMMLANQQLRISLVTTHLALKDVPAAITRQRVRRAITQTVTHLHNWWGIQKPRVAIAGLNPHAGENGILGREEIQVISPEIQALNKKARGSYSLFGPLPADTLFANHISASPKERFDAVVCMYHDQGLIPVKLLDFPKTVNVTLGLPLVRTSVDHGTGFDIAGQGKADPSSFESAVDLAIQIVSNRKKLRGARL